MTTINNYNPVYFPLLQTKRGELSALCELEDSIKDLVMPILVLPKNPSDKQLKIGDALSSKWQERPVYIDLSNARYNAQIALDSLQENDIKFNHVINLHHLNPFSIESLSEYNQKFCIRVEIDKLTDQTPNEINDFLTKLPNAKFFDILLDFGSIASDSTDAHLHQIRSTASFITKNIEYSPQRFIISGSSVPKTLERSDFNPDGLVTRTHWLAFERFFNDYGFIPTLYFSDYSVTSPSDHDFETTPTIMRPNAKVRYTLESEYLMLVRYQLYKEGFKQFYEIAEFIVNSGHFMSPSYSAGDLYISNVAKKEDGPGSLESWIKNAHNHHITLAAKQNANLHGS